MAYRRRPSNSSPREMTAKYAGKCRCGTPISPGDAIVYHRKTAYCSACGHSIMQGHLAEVSMERYGNDLGFER